MEALGAKWVVGTMGARWKWREQEQGGDKDIEKQDRDWGRMGTGTPKQSGNQGAVDIENGAVDRDTRTGGTGDNTGMRTVAAGLQPVSGMETGTRHRVGAHPMRTWLLKVPDPLGTSQIPGDGDKREQLGGQHRVTHC